MQKLATPMETIRQHVARVPLLDWDHEDTEVTPTTAVGARFRLPLPPPPEPEPTLDSFEEWPTLEIAAQAAAPQSSSSSIALLVAPGRAAQGRSLIASCSLVALATVAAAALIAGLIALV